MNQTNSEAKTLAASRLIGTIQTANRFGVTDKSPEELQVMCEDFALAKSLRSNGQVTKEQCMSGQEYYIQTLIDSKEKPLNELKDAYYLDALKELGSEEELDTLMEALREV